MSRNLLPRLREAPTPANITALPPGKWTPIQAPAELAKMELADEQDTALRTRIQSIPSPWARLLLFRNALEDHAHPARTLIENELLDALEFLWTLGSSGVQVELRRVRLDELRQSAQATGSLRVEDFAEALVELATRRSAGGGAAGSALPSLTLALVEGEPVLASSPYTLLFTAESAARPTLGPFFRFAAGGARRALHQRPVPFQAYVARVLLPQLAGDAPELREDYVDWRAVQGLVGKWLAEEVRACVRAARSDAVRAQVSPPADPASYQWRRAAEDELKLEPIDPQGFGGVVLYRRRPGAEVEHSRWRLRATRGGAAGRPLVVEPGVFDGRFYDGADAVRLPPDLRGLDRKVLPGLGVQQPWVEPAHDWLTDSLLLLSEPLEPEHVKGLAGYRTQLAGDPRFGEPRVALPLKADFFRYFSADDVDRMLAVDVLPGGAVAVSLTLEVGPDDAPEPVVVRRVYDDAHIRRETGPGLALWPSFQDARWSDYVAFRIDSSTLVAQNLSVEAYAGGRPISTERVQWTPLTETLSFTEAPEVLELRSTVAGTGERAEPLGVILPRFARPERATQARWEVGVDFGTSNTVISVREDGASAPRLFRADRLMLPLTHVGSEAVELVRAYFFPDALGAEPFGTAVVHLKNLPRLEVEEERVGLRVNVPYTGYVRDYPGSQQAVVGDLKWSNQRHSYFLSASFLRHVLATVLAEAIQHGVDPAAITLRWAYPRAFTPSQINQLRDQWRRVVKTFAPLGLKEEALREELDESTSVLRHFFNAGAMGTAGEMQVIVDVGGGTSDIAAYGRGRVLMLDSVMLGGRNLTGRRLQGASEELLGNPFVDAFFAWAREHGLPDQDRIAVSTYLANREVHLAFSYLVRTRWFAEGRAALFRADPAFHAFQALIFYFFGALFYYVGLTCRALAAGGETELPLKVVLAGNGSRYLDWLTDLAPSRGDDPFRRALASLAVAGAAPPDAAADADVQSPPPSPPRAPTVERSDKPKEEVARGLVALVDASQLTTSGAALTPVIGERLAVRSNGTERQIDATYRFAPDELVDVAWAHGVRWADGEMEIERFHRALEAAAQAASSYGEQWTRLPARYRAFFAGLDRRALQEETRRRMEYLANLENGYRGSIFLLEATAVLDLMRDTFFANR